MRYFLYLFFFSFFLLCFSFPGRIIIICVFSYSFSLLQRKTEVSFRIQFCPSFRVCQINPKSLAFSCLLPPHTQHYHPHHPLPTHSNRARHAAPRSESGVIVRAGDRDATHVVSCGFVPLGGNSVCEPAAQRPGGTIWPARFLN